MAQIGFDRRRINGPEDSLSPTFEPKQLPQPINSRQIRNPLEVRPIFLRPGLINQANGSAYIETQQIKIACAVYGPRQSKNVAYSEKGRLNVEVKFTPFSCQKRRAPMRDAEDRSIAMAVSQALAPSVRLDLLPKSTIDIFITIIEADGVESCIASGSLAASAALADAGIEIYGLVTSCSAALVNNAIWLDPTDEEGQCARGSMVLACMPALGTVTNLWQSGQMNIEESTACMSLCQSQCRDIHSVVVQALR